MEECRFRRIVKMELSELLKKYGFAFKKSLGQNFISDENLLAAIARDAGIGADDLVLEIGAGAGTLTRALAERAQSVIAFEIDSALEPILRDALGNVSNARVVFADVIKLSDKEISALTGGRPFKVAANIPYYVTTPILFRFLESGLPVRSITVTVQKEVADRITASPDTPEYGALTLAVALRGKAFITREIGRTSFRPAPNVDSAVVHIDIEDKYDIQDSAVLRRLARAGFQMRRKILAANIAAAFPSVPKDKAKDILTSLGYSESIRGEALGTEDYIRIADAISDFLKS